VARRAWLEAGQVLNARPLGDLLAWARPARWGVRADRSPCGWQ